MDELLHAGGEAAQVRRYFERALTIFAQQLGPQHPGTEQIRRMLTMLDTARSPM